MPWKSLRRPWDAAITNTLQQQRDAARAHVLAQDEAYRAAFRPHLQVQTERRIPSPIFVAAIIGVTRLRIVPIPDQALSGTERERGEMVKAIIIEHHRSHQGQIPAFGGITGYILVMVAGYDGIDFGLPFDVNGDPAGAMIQVARLPVATLGLKPGNDQLARVLSHDVEGGKVMGR